MNGVMPLPVKIYIDVLFAVNFIINFLLLSLCGKLMRLNCKLWRLLCAAACGGIFSLYILLPQSYAVVNIAAKILFGVIMTAAAFGFGGTKRFLKTAACLFFICFGFAGVMFLLWLIIAPPGMAYQNGVAYFNISPVTLVIASVACYFALKLLSVFVRQKAPDNTLFKLKLTLAGAGADVTAMLDTGNALIEAMTGLPVIVAEIGSVKALLPGNITEAMLKDGADSLPLHLKRRYRIIPFSSLGGKGTLVAFKLDNVELAYPDGHKKNSDAVLALYFGRLSAGSHTALIGNELAREE